VICDTCYVKRVYQFDPMFSFLKKAIITITALSILLSPALVLAKDYGLSVAADSAGVKDTFTETHPLKLAGKIIGVGLSALGVIFFVLVLYAGFKWMTAMGSSEKSEKAKEMLEAAGIGLVIILAAYAIARFVFTSLGIGA